MPDKPSVLLIYPPVSKPCEPPAGIARLAGVLKKSGVDFRIYDANLQGLLDLMQQPAAAKDTWTRRALKHLAHHLGALRSQDLYAVLDRYKRAVMDTNRVLKVAGQNAGAAVSLSDYAASGLSPVRSADLCRSAEQFAQNVFYFSFRNRLSALFMVQQPDIVGFSINFMSQALCAFAMAGFIKKILPDVRIVCGGGLITSWMHIPGFVNPFAGLVDELVCGPGEKFLLEMCGTDNAAACQEAGYDFSHFDMKGYLSPGPVIPYSTSRGCYWQKCAFCPEKSEQEGYRASDIRDVDRHIKQFVNVENPSLIHFTDNALSPRFLRYIIQNPPGAPWYGFVRVTPHLADPDFAGKLKSSGCVMLKLGVESGDQGVLDALEKGICLDRVSRVLKNLKNAGIATYVYLLFGTPAETLDEARQTLFFIHSHARHIDFLNLAIFNLPAYSKEAEALDTMAFYQGDLSLYREFVHPRGWHRDQVRRFLAQEFKKSSRIKNILHHDPPFFTSNHAPFVAMAAKAS